MLHSVLPRQNTEGGRIEDTVLGEQQYSGDEGIKKQTKLPWKDQMR